MQFIHYDNSAIMTGDAIARAVIEYAAVLGANERTDTVNVPSVNEDGSLTHATVLIGPASQIVLDPAPDDVLEPEDPDFIEDLRERAQVAGQGGTHPVHSSGQDLFGAEDGAA